MGEAGGPEKAKRKRPGPTPSGRGPLPVVLTIRGTAEWGEWVRKHADSRDVQVADLIEALLAADARRLKVSRPPPRT